MRQPPTSAVAAGPVSFRGKRRRTWPQRLVIAFNVFLVMTCLSSAYALAFYNRQLSDIPRVSLQSTLNRTSSQTDPQNFLIVGADNAEGLDATDPVVAGRNIKENLTDTIMILRIDPNQEKAWLLSLPRDLYLPIGNNRGKDRINTALALGGPELLIQTINENFGIKIDHFLQVNFNGFKQLVDAIDGVNVYFNYPAKDDNTGLNVSEPGCALLTGDQALAYARSRHYTAKIDGRWQEDPTSDHGRIARQQYFIKQALKKAIDKGARNPIQMGNLLGVAQNWVVIDDTLTPENILDLGARFNAFNPEDLKVYEPYTHGGMAGAASVLFLDEQPSQEILNIFRGVDASQNVLAAVRVEVRNGTGKVGEGQDVADDLKRRGFTVTGSSDDRNFRNDKTVIKYAPGAGNLIAGIVLARFMDGTPIFEEEPALAQSDHSLALVVGKDFPGIRTDARPLEDFKQYLPVPENAPTTVAEPTTTAPSNQPPAAPTTTGPPSPNARSIVPEVPEGVEC